MTSITQRDRHKSESYYPRRNRWRLLVGLIMLYIMRSQNAWLVCAGLHARLRHYISVSVHAACLVRFINVSQSQRMYVSIKGMLSEH